MKNRTHKRYSLSSYVLLILLSWSSWNISAQTEIVSLSGAIDYALNNSPDVKSAQLGLMDADAQIRETLATGLPQLNASGTYQRYFKVPLMPLPDVFTGGVPGVSQEVSFVLKNNLTGAVNLDAMIFNASYFVGLKAARAARNFAEVELLDKQRQVRNQVRDVYLPLLLIQANLTQVDKNIESLEELYRTTEATYQAGFVEQLDVDRLALSLANLKTDRESLDRQYENLVRTLKFTINYPEGKEITVADDMDILLSGISDEVLTQAANHAKRTELAVLDQVITLNEYNVTAIKTGYLPGLRAFGAYQYQYQGDDFSSGFWAPTAFVGLSLQVPIYDGGLKRANIARAEIAKEEVLLQKNTIERLVGMEVENARSAYFSAQQRFKDREDNLALATRIYDTTQIKYKEGVGSSLEVNQAEQSLYAAQTNRLQALYELLQAKVDLAEALGVQ